MKKQLILVGFTILILGLILLNLFLGKATIKFDAVWMTFLGKSPDEMTQNLILHYRLPKTITAILVGIALPVAGFQLQELFKNELAEPSVLGISAMSGLGVAIVIFLFSTLGFQHLLNDSWIIIFAAMLGALLALLIIGSFAHRIKSSAILIILGMMLSGLSVAFIGILQYFAPSERIKTYLIWSFGTLSALSWTQISIFALCVCIGTFLACLTLNRLTALLLGETYAQTLGVNIRQLRWTILISTALLTAAVTAFAGPISFIGLAVPHLCRSLLKTANMKLLFGSIILLGISLMLFFSALSDMFPFGTLPINIITSLFGTPIVISILLKNSKSLNP
ncbi:FecCD family ABC transporter permease [Vaginella massiliensis]|uniref:FecCD family ABC transporter permease n=1 Tax=Vaginella massiliensis TaxID=1816680 RepID=UPI0008385418|nr:iron ABC transporter permease [Vaginella massiliensis]